MSQRRTEENVVNWDVQRISKEEGQLPYSMKRMKNRKTVNIPLEVWRYLEGQWTV